MKYEMEMECLDTFLFSTWYDRDLWQAW
jgi:hypothetical protein